MPADDLIAALDRATYLPPSVEPLVREAWTNDERKTRSLVAYVTRTANEGSLNAPTVYLRKQLEEIIAAGPKLDVLDADDDEEASYVRPTAAEILAAFDRDPVEESGPFTKRALRHFRGLDPDEIPENEFLSDLISQIDAEREEWDGTWTDDDGESWR